MRKSLLYAFLIVSGAMCFMGCEEEFTENDALQLRRDEIIFNDSIQSVRDSLEKAGGIIDLSVNLANASGSGFVTGDPGTRVKGDPSLSGMVVSISQNGVINRDTVDETGIATFTDLRIGQVSVSIDGNAFSDVDMLVKIYAPYEVGGLAYVNREGDTILTSDSYKDLRRSAAVMVPLFSTTENTATISGRVTIETDLTNGDPEIGSGITVVGAIDVSNQDFFDTYFATDEFGTYDDDCDCIDNQSLRIDKINYNDVVFSGTTNDDGDYAITVPGTAAGLPIRIEVSEFAADQTLLLSTYNGDTLNAVATVRTVYSSEFNSTADVSPLPSVPSALVTIAPPTGTAGDLPDDPATAEAKLNESGLMAITITDQGEGYTQPPVLTVSAPGNPLGVQAEAEAILTNGKITAVNITEPGSGYDPNSTINVSANTSVDEVADLRPVITYSVESINITRTGQGYKSEPTVSIVSGQGSGASARAILEGVIDEVTLTNGGTGYICPPNVNFIGAADEEAVATAVMTTNNPIHSIVLSDNFNATYEEPPTVTIERVSEGNGARAIASLKDEGEITRIEITNPGSGYDEAPTVLITPSNGAGRGASAYATINGNGEVNAIIVTEEGEGYTADPVITLASPSTGGTQATAVAVRAFEIDEITLTNPGSGYNIVYNTFNIDDYANEPLVTISDGISTFSSSDGQNDADITVRPNMSVRDITINDAGLGYEVAPSLQFTAACEGSGSGATATSTIDFEINELEMITEGSGYEFDSEFNVVISCNDCDVQAEATIGTGNLGKGIVERVEIEDGGIGYIAPPHLRIINGGATGEEDVELEALVADGSIVGVNVTNNGGEISADRDIDFFINVDTKLAGASFSADAYPDAGELASIEITDAGFGYTTVPLVEFNNEGTGGFGAEAVATIDDGRVVGIEITNPGRNYVSEPDVRLVIPQFTRTARAKLTVDNEGFVTGINITDGGQGYIEPPAITISPVLAGVGTGASAEITTIVGGQVDGAFITSQGEGYTGKNTPGPGLNADYNDLVFGIPFTVVGGASSIDAISNKMYIRDYYLGTGKRTSEANEGLPSVTTSTP